MTPLSEGVQESGTSPPQRRHLWKRIAIVAGVLIVGYLIVAYVALPIYWMRYTRQHPSLADIPNITHTADGLPGDPLNGSLIGTEIDLTRIMRAAQWYPADPLSLRSRLEIAGAAVFEHPYADLQRTGELSEVYFIDGFHHIRQGRNGGGDPWFTDGRLEVGVIRVE